MSKRDFAIIAKILPVREDKLTKSHESMKTSKD